MNIAGEMASAPKAWENIKRHPILYITICLLILFGAVGALSLQVSVLSDDVARLDAEIDDLDTELNRKIDNLDTELNRKIDKIDQRIDRLDQRFDDLSVQLAIIQGAVLSKAGAPSATEISIAEETLTE